MWDGKCDSDPEDLKQFLPSMLVDSNSWESVYRGHVAENKLRQEQEDSMNIVSVTGSCKHSFDLQLVAAPTAFSSAMKIDKASKSPCPACRKAEWHEAADALLSKLDVDLPSFTFVQWGKPWKSSPKQQAAAMGLMKFFLMSIKDIVESSDVAGKALRNLLQSEGEQETTSFWFDFSDTRLHQKELALLLDKGGLTKAEKETLTSLFAAAGK